MWCPSCHSRSPLVAIQPEGLICARCQVEVEFGDRVAGEPLARSKAIGPHHAKSVVAKATPALAAVSDGVTSSLRLASWTSEVSASADSAATALNRPEARKSLEPQQPLYRFDPAHPPVGGRTQAAMKLQQVKHSSTSSATPAAAMTEPLPRGGTAAEQFASDARESLSVSPAQLERATTDFAEKDFALLRELAQFPDSKPKKAESPSAPHSEFALRPVPRSFLFPRRTNRWPGRLCLLSGGLFISGQSLLIYSFLRMESLGVATGILASAAAFALSLYMIARYCDEELER